jgi:hypothetical protein
MYAKFIPGEWYVLIICENCKTKYSLFHDLNREQSNFKGTYAWTCPKCEHQGQYDSEKLECYRYPTEGRRREHLQRSL